MLKALGSHVRGNVVGYIALFVALGGTAIAADGGNFLLGRSNSASSMTSLTRTGANAGKGLQVTNTSTGAGATALGLNVASGHTPFTVNSATKVANLNADKLDGVDSTGFLPSSSVKRLVYTAPDANPAPITPIATIGPFTIKGQCQSNALHTEVRLYVRMGPPSGTADSMWSETQDDTTDRGTKSTGLLIPTDTDLQIVQVDSGEAAYARGAGTSMLKEYGSGLVQVDFHAVADSRGTGGSCFIYGTATRVT
jgi:hypothetical protein